MVEGMTSNREHYNCTSCTNSIPFIMLPMEIMAKVYFTWKLA